MIMIENERYSIEEDKNAYKCINDNSEKNSLCTREDIVDRLNQQDKRIKDQRLQLNTVLKKYDELHNKFYDRDFFDVEPAGEYTADSRKFQNGLCVFNNRLGMAYSVTEIVEVLNHMTKVIHEFESMKKGKYEVVDYEYATYIRDATLTEDRHEGAITNVYQLCSLINTLINENQELKKQIKNLMLEKNDEN